MYYCFMHIRDSDYHAATVGMGMVKRDAYDAEKYHVCYYGFKYKSTKTNFSLGGSTIASTGNNTSRSTRNRSARSNNGSKNNSRKGTSRLGYVGSNATNIDKTSRSNSSQLNTSRSRRSDRSTRSTVSSRSMKDPMTGLPKIVVDPITGDELEPDQDTGRYYSR